MPNNAQSLLLTHRENYNVPTGQERSVHCKIAKLTEGGDFIEKPRLVHFGVKEFETGGKDNLELSGYTVEILYHPLKRYSNVVITDNKVELARKDAEIAELKARLEEKPEGNADELARKDAEIAMLKKELAKANKKEKKEEK